MRNLVKFNASSGKAENFHFDVLLFSKVYYVWASQKRHRGVMCHNTEEWCKTWGGDMSFEKWYEEFGEFWLNTQKSQNLLFTVLLLRKIYYAWAKKFQRSYVSWHGRVMQYLKKTWLVVWKMT